MRPLRLSVPISVAQLLGALGSKLKRCVSFHSQRHEFVRAFVGERCPEAYVAADESQRNFGSLKAIYILTLVRTVGAKFAHVLNCFRLELLCQFVNHFHLLYLLWRPFAVFCSYQSALPRADLSQAQAWNPIVWIGNQFKRDRLVAGPLKVAKHVRRNRDLLGFIPAGAGAQCPELNHLRLDKQYPTLLSHGLIIQQCGDGVVLGIYAGH